MIDEAGFNQPGCKFNITTEYIKELRDKFYYVYNKDGKYVGQLWNKKDGSKTGGLNIYTKKKGFLYICVAISLHFLSLYFSYFLLSYSFQYNLHFQLGSEKKANEPQLTE